MTEGVDHATASTTLSASRRPISPEMSLGRSRSRACAGTRTSLLTVSIRPKNDEIRSENLISTESGGITTSVSRTTSDRAAGYVAPSARFARCAIFSGSVAERCTTSICRACRGPSTANPVLPVSSVSADERAGSIAGSQRSASVTISRRCRWECREPDTTEAPGPQRPRPADSPDRGRTFLFAHWIRFRGPMPGDQ